jgi:hypothetical protein
VLLLCAPLAVTQMSPELDVASFAVLAKMAGALWVPMDAI